MNLSALQLTNFRNYTNLSLDFHKGPVVFVGKNSSGKTNILEAIDMLSLAKSFRKTSDIDMVQWNEDSFQIHADFIKNEEPLTLDMRFAASTAGGRKALLVNGAKCSLVTFLGTVLTVVFSPQDVGLLTLPPSARRRFVDVVLCKTSIPYCTALLEYPRIIASRNKLLHSIREGQSDPDELFFWDDKLVRLGAVIVDERRKMIEFANERISGLYEKLASNGGDKKRIEVEYKAPIPLSTTSSLADIESALRERVAKNQRQDLLFGSTQVGPHRDDILIKSNGYYLADVGSRGDQRIAVLALKLLQKDFLLEQTGTSPLLLLDDVYSELDEKRCDALTELIGDSQVLITTTSLSLVPKSLQRVSQVFSIKKGKAEESTQHVSVPGAPKLIQKYA